ncbi:hypothetical protein DERF_012043 [Dermatophagoides farinae]|uniref:Uncharacterized protein n=1 Tax=Dermatophagoides farinae TaxID=6954 RepID=A0A922L339_DERFA|nr:hypothetical protein DERF_012043 [Dermatophagoides farinae]
MSLWSIFKNLHCGLIISFNYKTWSLGLYIIQTNTTSSEFKIQNRENIKSKLTRPVQNPENDKSKLTRPVQNSKFKIEKITNPT